jgi:hypothetical protein
MKSIEERDAMSCHDGFADTSFPTREKSSADAAGHAASAPKFLAFRGVCCQDMEPHVASLRRDEPMIAICPAWRDAADTYRPHRLPGTPYL